MARGANQKSKLLTLYLLLLERTDEDHQLSTQQIIEYLEEDPANKENVERIKNYLAVNGAKA